MPDGTAVQEQPLTAADFAGKVRAKYPGSYDHLSDTQLVGKVIQKYPEYKEKISGLATTQFEKDRTQGERGAWSAVKRSLPGLFASPGESNEQLAGVATLGKSSAPDSSWSLGERVRRGWDAGGPGVAAAYGVGPLLGMDPQAAEQRAERADTSGILGQAAVPVATTLASSPTVQGIGGRVGGALRSGSEILGNKAAEITRYPATARQSQLGKPGTVKPFLPSMMQKYAVPDWLMPTGTLGTPTNPGPFMEIPARMPKSAIAKTTSGDLALPQGNRTPFPKPLRPLIGTPEEWASYDQQLAILRPEASDAGLYHAARGSANKKLNLQQRIGKRLDQ